ncbi:mycofactocin biosynthesis chaperone MftB [Skermania sp. ID1734]|uniref:mycofactocin biosynthesis chaperone MftB n=1 Tax=Skermania sp. ID1734 TaxID=2597516 RepID=UPI00117F721B|nr:mycofactocin biosynthesis chaperone MftB [Skermania sp. ID1734]TSE02188.1 mycofactocin biosynthesis chaperone MftB [Skermania sp. ID1734]
MTAMTMDGFDLEARWRLHPKVALRPEPFGALLYHFGTRKLSFLKNPTIVKIVESLPQYPTAAAAVEAAGVTAAGAAQYAKALATLADSHMLMRVGE